MNTIGARTKNGVSNLGVDHEPPAAHACPPVAERRAARILRKAAVSCAAGALFLFVLSYGVIFPSGALAWENCPKGLVNDPYPGRCGRYVDTNGDQICDLSQPKPTSTTATTATAAATVTTGEPPTGDCPLGPCAGCGVCFSLGVPVTLGETVAAPATLDDAANTVVDDATTLGDPAATSRDTSATAGNATATSDDPVATLADTAVATNGLDTLAAQQEKGASFLTHYLVSPIALGFFVIYGTSFLLYKTRRMRVTTHRKIWNVLLLGTFLVTGVFGVILAIQLDYPLPFDIPIDLLFWHVEAGIAMTLISFFHLGWHFNYYRNLLRRTRCQARQVRELERTATPPRHRPLAGTHERVPVATLDRRASMAQRSGAAWVEPNIE